MNRAWDALRSGRVAEAEQIALQTLTLSPHAAQANLLLGIVNAKKNNLVLALQYLRGASNSDPNLFQAFNWTCSVLCRLGEAEEALTYGRRATQLEPMNGDAWNNLGLALLGQRKTGEAVKAFQESVKISPKVATTYLNLGNALVFERDYEAAEEALTRALQMGLKTVSLYLRLCDIKMDQFKYHEAVRYCELALEIDPESPVAHTRLGTALGNLGRITEAREHLELALRITPDAPDVWNNLGSLLQSSGLFDEAKKCFTASLAKEPQQSAAYLGLLNCGKATDLDIPTITAAETLALNTALAPIDLCLLHFALGKARDDLKEYEVAMSHFDQAHILSAKTFQKGQFQWEGYQAAVERLKEICEPVLVGNATLEGNPSRQPIFVVGMIRSGTTLTEQILSSHPQVQGVGEQGFIFDRSNQAEKTLQALGLHQLPDLAFEYLARLNRLAPGADRIVDKQPGNYLVAGLIHLAFPNAKIIHAMRDPVDTCLSIWFTANRTPPNWSNRREDIVFTYRSYLDLMSYWRTVLPPHAFAEFHYDDLVNNTEATVRSMLEFCELPWDDACLQHDKNENPIHTPSVWQARQPIYRSSLRRRDNYRDFLGEFAELLQA
jgi:tetratricopeptide (TPR) repeat protein